MKFLLNSVFLTVCALSVAIISAYAMSNISSKSVLNNSNSSNKDTSSTIVVEDTSKSSTGFDKEAVKPTDGGLKGGDESAIKSGRLESSKDKEINTNPEVFSYKLNHSISLESPTSVGTIMVENDPGNKNLMQLSIYLNDNQKLVYVSPMIKPNQHINGDKLIARLKKGEYKATAVIGVYDAETKAIETTIYEDVKINVNDSFLNSIFG